jgi:excisionase family DNA binding protein
MSERRTYTVEEAAKVLGISRGVAYESARSYLATGDGLPVLRYGRRLVVPRARLDDLLGEKGER